MKHAPDPENAWEVLALDIGGGTQDLLLWSPRLSMENAIQCVLPSPTVMVARRIAEATRRGLPIFLRGELMGGGASSRAIREHLKAGLQVYAEPQPARTLHDNLDYVRREGIIITDQAPPDAEEVRLSDIQSAALRVFLEAFGLDLPRELLVAVQDHGYSPLESNRVFRFRHWERFLTSGKPLESLLYREIPETLTRMAAVRTAWPRARVMDTGAAAILGALEDERLKPDPEPTVLVVNVGNEHTLAAWLVRGAVKGIYEHHTFFLNREKLLGDLETFVTGRIGSEQVLEDRGHGCLNLAPAASLPSAVWVTGPRRELLAGTGVHMAVPHGNMMLSGCFGLLRAHLYLKASDFSV